MPEYPLVSIVTPSYNQGHYIEETILSVLDQDYPNLEHIVVDGGSTDKTLEILKKYETHLLWVSEKDHGQADALNKGFRMAKGEILGWVNSDDIYLPGAVGKIAQYFQHHPDVGMVYGEGRFVYTDGVVLDRFPSEPFNIHRLSECCFICQPAAFFRSMVFREIGALDVNLHYCLDYEYWIRVAQRFRINYLNDYLANARLQMEAKTVAQQVKTQEETLRVMQKYYKRVPASGIDAYAYFYLRESLMPNLQGIDKDGWAEQRVRVLLRGDWRPTLSVVLEGVVPKETAPLALRIVVGERAQPATIFPAGKFAISTQVVLNGLSSYELKAMEIKIQTEKSFCLPRMGINSKSRSRSYRIRKLSVIDKQGREITIYSIYRALLFFFLQPLFFLCTFLCLNHYLPWTELKQSGGRA